MLTDGFHLPQALQLALKSSKHPFVASPPVSSRTNTQRMETNPWPDLYQCPCPLLIFTIQCCWRLDHQNVYPSFSACLQD